jgi:hypothetical protein
MDNQRRRQQLDGEDSCSTTGLSEGTASQGSEPLPTPFDLSDGLGLGEKARNRRCPHHNRSHLRPQKQQKTAE